MDALDTFKAYLLRRQMPDTVGINMILIRKVLLKCEILDKETLDIFINALMDKNHAPSYIRQHVSIIRHWGECFSLPELSNYIPPKIWVNRDSFIKAIFSDEEIDKFLALPFWGEGNGTYKDRYHMMTIFFTIWAYTGMRGIEIAKMTTQEVDYGRNIFIVRKGKKRAERIIPISPFILPQIKKYIASLDQPYLFPAFRASKAPHITESAWETHFNKRRDILGIKRKNLTPYSFRHSFITRQIDEDVSIAKIQQIVGHKKLDTTAKYIHLSTVSMQKVINNDRLIKRHESPEEAMEDIYEDICEVGLKYIKKILTGVSWDNEGNLTVVFKRK